MKRDKIQKTIQSYIFKNENNKEIKYRYKLEKNLNRCCQIQSQIDLSQQEYKKALTRFKIVFLLSSHILATKKTLFKFFKDHKPYNLSIKLQVASYVRNLWNNF